MLAAGKRAKWRTDDEEGIAGTVIIILSKSSKEHYLEYLQKEITSSHAETYLLAALRKHL